MGILFLRFAKIGKKSKMEEVRCKKLIIVW